MFLRAAVFWIVLFAGVAAHADEPPIVREAEPNDTPAEALAVSGEVTIAGALADTDQDGYMWTVSDVDAEYHWSMELLGVPGTQTVVDIVRVELDANGEATSKETLLKFGSRDGTRPGRLEDVLLAPGDYLLGVSKLPGEGEYRLRIERADKLPRPDLASLHPTRGNARRARSKFAGAAYLDDNEIWYRWPLSEKDAGQRFVVSARVPIGRTAELALTDAGGKVLDTARSDARGRMTLPDLGLGAGTYHLRLRGEEDAGHLVTLRANPDRLRVAGEESEPNDREDQANRVDLSQPVTGRLAAPGDADHFVFELPEDADAVKRRIVLTPDAPGKVQLCLVVDGHAMCRSGDDEGDIELSDLVLPAGAYGLSVSRSPTVLGYTLRMEETGAYELGTEAEPNDQFETAVGLGEKRLVKGRFQGQDRDHYLLQTTGEPQLWRIQAVGDGLHDLEILDPRGSAVGHWRVSAGDRRLRTDNVFLLPGFHTIMLSGADGGEYTLRAIALGPANPDVEREPNDEVSRSHRLDAGQRRIGSLAQGNDRDYFRFHLAAAERMQIIVTPPPDGAIMPTLEWYGTQLQQWRTPPVGEPVVLDGLYPPGDYTVSLMPKTVSDAEYTIELTRLPRLGCPSDCEPNDNTSLAAPLAADHVLVGRVGQFHDDDWYRLPLLDSEATLTVRGISAGVNVAVVEGRQGKDLLQRTDDPEVKRATLAAGQRTYIRTRGKGEYRYDLGFDPGPTAVGATRELPVLVEVVLEVEKVAAYRLTGQLVGGVVRLRNQGQDGLALELESAVGRWDWTVELDQTAVELKAGGEAAVPFTLRVAPDAWADRPVSVSFAARDGANGHAEGSVELDAGRDVRPVSPVPAWPIPDGLLGGLDLARTELGGRWLDADDVRYKSALGHGFAELFDGITPEGGGMILRGAWKEVVEVTVELAGGGLAPVAGFILNPLSSSNGQQKWLRDFEIQLSMDGHTWDTVLAARLEPIPAEQAFVLDQPRPARFAKLRPLTAHNGLDSASIALGEWKVVTVPGNDPISGGSFNIAAPELGGHVVWARPNVRSWNDELLTEKREEVITRVHTGSASWVVGFHHDRAAKIRRLEWVPGSPRYPSFDSVDLAVSTDGPLGPWTPLERWDLSASGAKSLDLNEAVWARFVKFSGTSNDHTAFPDTIRIFEVPADDDYHSILGEWGHLSAAAIYEQSMPVQNEIVLAPAGNTSRETAQLLPTARAVHGRTRLEDAPRWYAVVIPDEENTLSIELAGPETVAVVGALSDEAGNPVPMRLVDSGSRRQRFDAVVDPGGIYYLEVQEPPRNVLWLWDTSASVGAYITIIYNALDAFAEDVVRGRESVNLLPFGGSELLKDWSGESYLIQTALAEYGRSDNSSEAEKTLALAADLLAERPGSKAIVVITDAATNQYTAMWDRLEAAKPRVFSLGVSSQGAFGRNPPREQDHLEDWAAGGGVYTHLSTIGDLERGFDRAIALLRRPIDFSVTADTGYREAPGPGTLRVVSQENGGASVTGPAVELILDASGSMLQRIEGRRRIEVAREVLSRVVTEQLPEGTPVALRVFGHKTPNACETDLVVPLAPLDTDKVVGELEKVNAKNLARTPIAESLRMVSSDLARAPGAKIVVLVTDGEETCEGDPAKVIEELAAKGVDVRIDIVGFAIDNAALEQSFREWATLGGGRYHSADASEDLDRALREALAMPYSVLDLGGTVVAEGIVDGDPIELEAGFYRIRVGDTEISDVEIPGEEEVTVRVE